MKKIIITESQFNKLFILTESQESKSISQAKKLLMNRLGYSDAQADEFIRIKLRNDLPVLRSPQGGKFILGVTRMFLDHEILDADTITQLNSTLKLVASDAHINEYDRNLNGMHAGDLIERFETARGELVDQDRESLSQSVYERNNDYKIIPINSFEEAQQYGQYTSWCVTHYQNMFDSYTSDGINQFYFCLKNGFENLQPQQGENFPLDEYGLSMIAVSVDSDGALNTCTCRWNHDNGGNDSIMDTKEISQVIGQNFYEVFKPNNHFDESIEKAISLIAYGEDPEDIFDDWNEDNISGGHVFSFHDKWNILSPKLEIMSDKWYSFIIPIARENKYIIERKGKQFNLFDRSLQPMIDTWVDKIMPLWNGDFQIRLNKNINIVDNVGKFRSPIWFDCIYEKYPDNHYIIKKNDLKNLLLPNGRLALKTWVKSIGHPYYGWMVVNCEGKYNFINLNGDVLLPEWVSKVSEFDNTLGIAEVIKKINNDGFVYNYVNTNGQFLSDEWFDICVPNDSNNGDFVAMVSKDNVFYYLYPDGTLKPYQHR